MSLSNILVSPNDYKLFADSLTANTITANNLVFTNTDINHLRVNTINELITNAGVNIEGILIKNDQTINFPSIPTAGINLPNSAGSPSLLNFYEENTFNTTITARWATPPAVTIRLIRIGKIITITLIGVTATSNSAGSTFVTTSNIPAEFRPSQTVTETMRVVDTTETDGKLILSTGGQFTFSKLDGTNFGNAVAVGFVTCSLTYCLN